MHTNPILKGFPVSWPMRRRGAQGIILGCTEIQMILSQKHVSDLPLFDSMTLHVKADVDVQLGKNIEDYLPGKY